MTGEPERGADGGIVPKTPPGLRLRPMRREDVPAVLSIERLSFTLPWSETTFLRELEKVSLSHLLVVEGPAPGGGGADPLLGYACWWEVTDECHITDFAVAPSARRRGVGDFLLNGLLEDARRRGAVRATLEVRVSNEAAISLYEKWGFSAIAMRQRYYPDNDEDALVMWKDPL
ncbi:MAG: ribosomal protein S18-alanine N-acetyltransferase [Candidatus Tectomicrobia bacterium]|uniref:Ribosomal protein S18-alanine N-acetyltransferase n=1 Tax=Tectimicrobiota bacterium TaxID=2528274 RepID=A0A932I349_UNCTE|nr:ribosomal protein S18-alanine N-acetyltransferase [Candidatus Tectomicrobia bacterium]